MNFQMQMKKMMNVENYRYNFNYMSKPMCSTWHFGWHKAKWCVGMCVLMNVVLGNKKKEREREALLRHSNGQLLPIMQSQFTISIRTFEEITSHCVHMRQYNNAVVNKNNTIEYPQMVVVQIGRLIGHCACSKLQKSSLRHSKLQRNFETLFIDYPYYY